MISLLCPSRGRPERFAAMAESFREHTHGPHEILCWLDHDDPRLLEYMEMTWEMGLRIVSDKGRVGSSAMWNGLAEIATGDKLMMVNDDSLMRTGGWDQYVDEEVPSDGYYVAWPFSQGRQCTNPIVSRAWYDTLGYFIPPGYKWWYCDTSLQRIGAEAVRLVFLPKISCEHMFPKWGKAEDDATYQRNDNDDEREADKQHFQASAKWLASQGEIIDKAIFRAAGHSI